MLSQSNSRFAEKKSLEDESMALEAKLFRTGQLVEGLSGERTRWMARSRKLEKEGWSLTDHCLFAVK